MLLLVSPRGGDTIPSSSEFLVVRQPPPPSPAAASEEEEEYRRYVDSDLYHLPSAPLRPLANEQRSDVAIGGSNSLAGLLDLSRLDVSAALDQDHTDGHTGVLHVNTNALIVGDHCVGKEVQPWTIEPVAT